MSETNPYVIPENIIDGSYDDAYTAGVDAGIDWQKTQPAPQVDAVKLSAVIDDLDAARAEGSLYTYGAIQERLRGLVEAAALRSPVGDNP